MSDRLLQLYHAMPQPVRTVAATLKGLRLRWWRYGPGTEALVGAALEREHWSAGRMKDWQDERLAFLLHRAETQVPWYREHWAERRRRGDRASSELLEHWPLLTKDALRANPQAFIADDRQVGRLFEVNTSGTTGKPMRVWRSREVSGAYYALLEARFRHWHGVSWHDNWAVLGGQAVVRPDAEGPPFWVRNRALHQLYLSANHVSARNAPAYAAALARYDVNHLVAYASSATELARQCLAAGVRYDGLKVVITNAEPLLPDQREAIHNAFGAPARETYGMVEIVAGASECPSGTLHYWPELGRVDVLQDHSDEPVSSGTTGRLVCTGLVNTDMPLIRYLVGDRGSMPAVSPACPCGRTLPVLGPIEGRSNDMLIAPDGRRVFWLNPVFYGLPVQEAQIVQERLDRITVRYVPSPEFTAESAATVISRLHTRMGEVQVVLDPVAAIPRGPNGKFQAVVCRVTTPGHA